MLQKIAPALVEKAKELHRVYQLIDQLEEFVKNINRSVKKMEDQVCLYTRKYFYSCFNFEKKHR